ncbi:MAG: radical SAM protein [Ignavibacteriae bacterium]|nr:radical SAM protein [Ignavibacteriota bacterium]
MLETYVLHITKECNMECVYCYEKDKTSVYNWDDIKQLLDNIIKYNKHFNLEFLGGEPCLRMDLIEQTIDYLNSFSDVTVNSFGITTNGTIIDDTLIKLLEIHDNVSWNASLDGNRIMNSLRITKTGVNSHDIVLENFKKLLEIKPNKIGIHLVTHPFNIGYLNDGIKHLYKHGVRRFGIGTVETTIVIDDDYCISFINQCKKLSDKIKNGEYPGISIDIFNYLKPKTDGRHYIKDKEGKTILETYGRAYDDIKDSEEFKTPSASSNLGTTIYDIRETVYNYHNFGDKVNA